MKWPKTAWVGIAGGVVVAAVILAVWWGRSTPDSADDAKGEPRFADYDGEVDPEGSGDPGTARRPGTNRDSSDRRSASKERVQRDKREGKPEAAQGRAREEKQARRRNRVPRSGERGESDGSSNASGSARRPEQGRQAESDRAAVNSDPTRSYDDPTNRQVLGPQRWMAEVPAREEKAIQRELDREEKPDYPVSVKDRREAVGRATGVVHGCFDELVERRPAAAGQLVVAFELVIQGGTAGLEAPRTRDVVDLEDPRFLKCLRRGLLDVQFPGERDGRMTVEYPFFLGDLNRGPTR